MSTDALISNVLAGILIAVMNITVAISVAALMFSGLPAEYLSPGIVVLLIGTLIVGLGGTLFCDFSGVVCAPRSGLAPVFAAIVGGVYGVMEGMPAAEILPTVLVAVMCASIVTGLFLLLLGQLRMGGLVRYIPFPVMGGFFAGIGYIFIRGGLTVAMGAEPSLDLLDNRDIIMLGVPAAFFALALYVGLSRVEHWATFPTILVLALLTFYLVAWLADVPQSELSDAGWLPVIESAEGSVFPVVPFDAFANIQWSAIFSASGGITVVALLSAIILLLDTSGIEIITRKELNPNRELRVMGLSNITSGLFGGYPGVHVASDTAFTYKLGGDRQLMGFVYAAVVLSTLLIGTDFIASVPTFILGGLLIYVGLDFLIDWVWKTRKELPFSDYLIVLAILGAIAVTDILEGVAFGCAIAVVMFVVNYSRISVIKTELDGRDHASNIDRDLETREVLNDEGDRILILMLQGFIFFGTSDRLINAIRDRVSGPQAHKLEYLILDFHHVTQLDTSAVKAFTRLSQLSERFGFHIVITGADGGALDRMGQLDFLATAPGQLQHLFFDELDDGVAWCEDNILKKLERTGNSSDRQLKDLLDTITGDSSHSEILMNHFEKQTPARGELLFRQGDPGDALYLVGAGELAVELEVNGRPKIVRRFTVGAILGEMALYTGAPRSATVRVEEDSVLYRLKRESLDELERKNAAALSDIHRYVVSLLSERLSRANRELSRYL